MSTIPPTAPPIDPEHAGEPPAWPKVVGIISICWGALAMCCGGFGLLSPLAMNLMPPEQRSQFPPSMISGGQVVTLAAGIALDVILIVGGILCLTRRPIARPLHLAYALLSVAAFAVGAYFHFQQQAVLDQWARENPDSQFAKQMQMGGNMGNAIGLAVGAVIGLAYPLFCAIWFGLVKRTPESMGTAPSADYI